MPGCCGQQGQITRIVTLADDDERDFLMLIGNSIPFVQTGEWQNFSFRKLYRQDTADAVAL